MVNSMTSFQPTNANPLLLDVVKKPFHLKNLKVPILVLQVLFYIKYLKNYNKIKILNLTHYYYYDNYSISVPLQFYMHYI